MPQMIDFLASFWASLTADKTRTIAVSANRNFANSDNGKIIVVNPPTKNSTVTLTLPTGLTLPFACAVKQGKQGRVIVAAAGGVTFPFDAKLRTMQRKDDRLAISATALNKYTLGTRETDHYGSSVCAVPTMSVAAGTYQATQSVTLASATPGAKIYYTTDGSTPTLETGTLYSGAISIAASATLQAIAVKPGVGVSAVASAAYVIQCATPTFSPVAGSYVGTKNVTISSTTPGTTIYYTLNGTTPTTASTLYAGPVAVTLGTKTLKALAVKTGLTDSAVGSATYVIS